jgi:glycosyltransferase involved in cell wall biosynthesis
MPSDSKVHGVLVTFRRSAILAETLGRLAKQTRRLDTLVVVDNDSVNGESQNVVMSNLDAAENVEYLASPSNLGPAGGLSLGASHIQATAKPSDWIMFLDDDNPPRTEVGVEEVVAFAEEMALRDRNTAGVGLVGARFDYKEGRIVRLPDRELRGPIEVDHIGGNQLPCYRVSAMREVGLPDTQLFFGFDDLEYGLRLSEAGRRLYVRGDLWAREREFYGRRGRDKAEGRRIGPIGWRDYYSIRNLVWILRSRGHHLGAARVIVRSVIGKSVYSLSGKPHAALAHLRQGLHASFDAYTGRMGRTIEPDSDKYG